MLNFAFVFIPVLLIFTSYFFSWEKTAEWFVTLVPLYYAPFLLMPDIYGDESEILRAGKDVFLLSLTTLWMFHFFRCGTERVFRGATAIFVLLFILLGLSLMLLADSEHILVLARIYVVYPIWFFIARKLYPTIFHVRVQVYRWLLVALIVSIIGILEWFLFDGGNFYSIAAGQTRVVSTLFSPNALGWYLVAMNSLLPGVIRHHAKGMNTHYEFTYFQAIVIYFITTLVIVMSGSRSAMVFNIILLLAWVIPKFFDFKVLLSIVFLLLMFFLAYLFLPPNINILELRTFSGLETSRWDIYDEIFRMILNLDIMEVIFGTSSVNLSIMRDLGLIDDSFVLGVIASGGVIAIAIFLTAVLMGVFSYYMQRKYHCPEQTAFLHLVAICTVLGFISNLQGIFPAGLIFWMSLGLLVQIGYKDRNLKSALEA